MKYDFVESATETVENSTYVQHLIKKLHFTCAFSRYWEYLQQTELNSAASYPTSESTALFNLYFHQQK